MSTLDGTLSSFMVSFCAREECNAWGLSSFPLSGDPVYSASLFRWFPSLPVDLRAQYDPKHRHIVHRLFPPFLLSGLYLSYASEQTRVFCVFEMWSLRQGICSFDRCPSSHGADVSLQYMAACSSHSQSWRVSFPSLMMMIQVPSSGYVYPLPAIDPLLPGRSTSFR